MKKTTCWWQSPWKERKERGLGRVCWSKDIQSCTTTKTATENEQWRQEERVKSTEGDMVIKQKTSIDFICYGKKKLEEHLVFLAFFVQSPQLHLSLIAYHNTIFLCCLGSSGWEINYLSLCWGSKVLLLSQFYSSSFCLRIPILYSPKSQLLEIYA